jgi:MFS family permease
MEKRETVSRSRATLIRGTPAMWIVAAALAITYVLSTLPTPLYVLYREGFHFSQIMLTLVYAVYIVGTTAAIFFLGRLSDQIGRRPVLLVSLGIGEAGALLFAFAASTIWLFPARILSGLAIALASGAATAWIIELHPRQDKAASTQLAIAANLAGLGLGSILAGLLAQYGPWPLRLPYLVFLALLAPIILLATITAIAGAATGLGYRCGLQVVNEIAPENQRAEVVSSYLIFCYGGTSLPVIGVGLVSQASSALIADGIFAAVIAALAVIAAVVEVKMARHQ